jgi:hypothetical protein
MPFYKLEYSVDAAVIGVFPQARISRSCYQDGERAFVHVNVPLEGKIEGDILPPRFILEKRAKVVDLLATGTRSLDEFLVLSPRAWGVLQQFEVDECQAYTAEVTRGDTIRTYHLVHFPWSRNRDYINWERSVFGHTTQFGQDLIQILQFPNYDAFYAYKKPLFKKKERIGVEALFLREEAIDKDIFRLLFIRSGVYVSERLKDALQKEGITGCRFVPLEDLSEGLTREAMIRQAALSKNLNTGT